MSYKPYNGTYFANGQALDPFGRIRTSAPYTLFDCKALHDKAPVFWNEVASGAGAATWNSESSISMAVSGTGDYVIRQTKNRYNYLPGKGQ